MPVLIIEESSKAKFRRDEQQPNPKIVILNGRASSIFYFYLLYGFLKMFLCQFTPVSLGVFGTGYRLDTFKFLNVVISFLLTFWTLNRSPV